MDTNEKLKKERTAILQIFAEMYEMQKGIPPVIVTYKKISEYEELTEEQIKLLHFFLVEEYNKKGLDLIGCIKKTGEEVIPGQLTQYEIKELTDRADDVIVFLGVLNMRKAAMQNNSQ